MFQITYDPRLLNSLISTIYFGDGEIENSSSKINNDLIDLDFFSPVILGRDKINLFYLSFDRIIQKWRFYHFNEYWDFLFDNEDILLMFSDYKDCLEKNIKGYMGVFKDQRISMLYYLDNTGNPYFNSNFDTWIDFRKNILFIKKEINNILDTYEKPIENYNDIIIPIYNGLLHLNPKSVNDLIFSSLTIFNCNQNIDETMKIFISDNYYRHLEPTIQCFKANIQKIQFIKPKSFYSEIYKLIMENDKKYFDGKMKQFQKQVITIFKNLEKFGPDKKELMANVISDFIINLKNDFAKEISIIYHRLRHYPNERLALYKKYPNHPYIKLIKMVHQFYKKESFKYITNIEIHTFLEKSDINFIIYDEKTSLIMDTIMHRSELFVFMYNQYLNTTAQKIKPKYQIKYNYFPFKVFSPYLFIMEHILTR